MKKLISMAMLAVAMFTACKHESNSKTIQQMALEKVGKFGRESNLKYRTMSTLVNDSIWHFWCQDLNDTFGMVIYYWAQDSLGTKGVTAYQIQYWPTMDAHNVIWNLQEIKPEDSSQIAQALALVN